MPRSQRPPTSGYARLAQAEEEEDSGSECEADAPPQPLAGAQYASKQPPRANSGIRMGGRSLPGSPSMRRMATGRRSRANSGVDLLAINARFERWADEIAHKFRRRTQRDTPADTPLEIHHSVFQPPVGVGVGSDKAWVDGDVAAQRMAAAGFEAVVESVRAAMELGVHPTLITQGSSGSYFARNAQGGVVGVFKPKDEEPYASRNPKWTKWIHRNLFPFFFGRACLIPNLSYVSEAAAFVLDAQLRTHLVPCTGIVFLSSKAFHYDFWDRRAFYRRRTPLPDKPGSFQLFLKGFQDANIFLKQHPWPDQHAAGPRPAFWTAALQQSFREQLEKLVILDYIMRNTDRGLDNWMIRIDHTTQQATILAEPPTSATDEPAGTSSADRTPIHDEPTSTISIGAIDNSLSWPWKHPDAWRSYPFGWLFLPVSLIGQPFSEATRRHFLPLLTSNQWWSETQKALRQCFSQDSDFKERMYAKQLAVVKGQAWNVVETLKIPDHGPLELTRRARVAVWDDVVEIPIAVPLRAPSAEMRTKQQSARHRRPGQEHEEMDITALSTPSQKPQADLIISSPPLESAHENRFNLSRDSSSLDIRLPEGGSASSAPAKGAHTGPQTIKTPSHGRSNHHARASYDDTRYMPPGSQRQQRRLSLTNGRDLDDYGLDDEGDLGYAANEDMEDNKKKVIVERLEMIKGKNPVFTWC